MCSFHLCSRITIHEQVISHGNKGESIASSSESIKGGSSDEILSPADSKIERPEPYHFAHISILIMGIIIARFGLWIVDLTITQILQERVEEERRGVVNGVQDSLNNSMDLLKCILVILLPSAENFGYLIILSFVSISTGWIFYALFSRQQRGHLFHFCRLIQYNSQVDIEQDSHWPFFPEQENRKSKCYNEEVESLRNPVPDDLINGEEQDKNESDYQTIKNLHASKLEDIIDCEADVKIRT